MQRRFKNLLISRWLDPIVKRLELVIMMDFRDIAPVVAEDDEQQKIIRRKQRVVKSMT